MKQRKLLALLSGVCLVLILVALPFMGACAKPAPPPPTPAPTPKPAPSPKQEVSINIFGSKLGTSGYVLSHGLSDLINKHSTWLRATVVETTGATENVRTLAVEPAKRKTTVVYFNKLNAWQASNGIKPFEKPYKTFKVVSGMINVFTLLATLDPDIKGGMDLVGKRVAISPPGFSNHDTLKLIFEHGWGIQGKVIEEPLGFADGKDALINGLIDVATQGAIIVKPGEIVSKPVKVVGSPATMELVDRAGAYMVDYGKVAIEKTVKATGAPFLASEVPAGTFGKNQPNVFWAPQTAMPWGADAEMPDDIVYEIVRIIYEYAGEFKNYHVTGAAITSQGMGAVPGTTEADFHPGAVKFFKERGLKIGS